MIGKQDRYIKKTLDETFKKDSRLTEQEKDMLFSYFIMLADDFDHASGEEWRLMLVGVIQFLRWAGRITEDQDEKLSMLVNEIMDKRGA